jgi:hypothetical protein
MSQDPTELSGSGAPIWRHQNTSDTIEAPRQRALHLAEIEAHVEKLAGPIEQVLSEKQSHLIQLDLLWVGPGANRPYHLFVTSGVSDLPMAVPEGMEAFNRCELLIALPREWPVSMEAFADENHYWPLRWLKQIGHLPHQFQTWIGWGHSIPNGDPPEPIADTRFAGVVLVPPFGLPVDFCRLETQDGTKIHFWLLLPLLQDELDYKLEHGQEALQDLFEKRGLGFVLDARRRSVVSPGGWWKRLFGKRK